MRKPSVAVQRAKCQHITIVSIHSKLPVHSMIADARCTHALSCIDTKKSATEIRCYI